VTWPWVQWAVSRHTVLPLPGEVLAYVCAWVWEGSQWLEGPFFQFMPAVVAAGIFTVLSLMCSSICRCQVCWGPPSLMEEVCQGCLLFGNAGKSTNLTPF
jgi:hypothetical protein